MLAASSHWVHNLNPDIIRFSDTIAIRWYGVAYIAGFLVAAWLLKFYHTKGRSPINPDQQASLSIWLFGGVFLGGRLGSMFLYSWDDFISDPMRVFRVWEGGMASHGGFIGVALGLFFFCRSQKMPFRQLGDIVVTLAPAGLFFGRIANFINGELWGKVTDVSWAVVFPRSAQFAELAESRHPSQLYEAALEGLFLLIWSQWRFWKTDVVKTHPGRLAGEFLILYAVVRAIGEVFREPDSALVLGLSKGTFYSIFLVVAGLIFVLTGKLKTSATS